MSIDKTLKNRLSLNRPSNIRKSSKTPVSKIVTESRENSPPKPSESEIFKREIELKFRELEEIAKRAEMMRILEEEEKLIQKKKDDEKLQEKLASPFTGRKQVDMKPSLEYAIEEILPKAQISEQIEYPEPFQEEPALNRELAEFKRKINQHLHQVGFMGSGGGGIGDIKDAGDVDGGTALVDGKFLKFDSSTQKFVGSDASVSNETIQDIVGAMVSSNTESGITVAYQDADGTLDFTVGTLNQDTTGNAATATALETARNIGGVSFDGTGNINLPGVNTSGSQDTSGNAATATALATARNIAGVSFDGTANISLALTNLGISDGSDGQFLKTDGSGTFSFASVSATSLAADNLTAGDAAINLTTSSGNITIDAAANNSDIIFKGTDASSDITMLTLDGSDAGTAIFNNDIKLQSDDAVIAFGADGDVTLTHDPDDGLFLKSSATGDNNPVQITLQTGETDIQADDAIGIIKFQAPDEATGSDANLVVASFAARSEGDFSATANATFFEFRLSTDGANVRVAKLSNNGNLQVNGTLTADATSTLLIKNSSGSTLKTVNGFAANS